MDAYIDLKDGTYIVVGSTVGSTTGPVVRRLAEGRAFLVNSHDLPPNAEVDVAEVSAAIRALEAEVNAQFVGRGDLVHMAALALAGGDHAFTQSPPGTGKSRIYRLLSEGVGGRFFGINMAKDTTREMLFGPPSMSAIREDRWDRQWSGLATAHVALIDEVWQANAAVTTLMKGALEERIVEEAGVSRRIPLLAAFAASNFLPENGQQGADWDRWLYRLPVSYLSSAAQMRELAFAGAGSKPIVTRIEPREVLALNAYIDYVSSRPPDHFVNEWITLWEAVRSDGFLVGDRRWKRLIKAATAEAILQGGDEPTGRHLSVARWILWDTPDQFRPLAKLVVGLTDPVAGDVLDCEKLAEALQDRAAGLTDLEWSERARVGTAASRLKKKVDQVLEGGADGYSDRLQAVKDLAHGIEKAIMDSWSE